MREFLRGALYGVATSAAIYGGLRVHDHYRAAQAWRNIGPYIGAFDEPTTQAEWFYPNPYTHTGGNGHPYDHHHPR